MANNTAQNLKETIESAQEVKENLNTAIEAVKGGKLQVGAVVRLIVLLIAWINQIAVTFGLYSVPDLSPSVIYIIATIITIIATVYSYWKNNSWTSNAKTADVILNLMKTTGITTDDICDAVGTIIDNTHGNKKSGTG